MKAISNLFNLFRKPTTKVEDTHTSGLANDVMEDIFVDNTPPVSEEPVKPVNPMKTFLSTNYQAKGYNDGYYYHSADVMDNNLRLIKAEFRQLVDVLVDEKQREIYVLKDSFIESEGISDRTQRRLENRIQELETMVRQLANEKDLSAFDEGLVSGPLNSYQDGFTRGLEKYQAEKLLAHSTGLFY